MRLHGPSGQRFLADSLRSSGIVNTALGSDNVRWLTHIILIESQKDSSHFPHEPLPSVKNNLQDIIAYMQVNSPNYKQDITH